jgi:glycosyltransferase involved in cell wall biosynthesis
MIEGLGLTPLESAACGCVPIIGTRNSYESLFPKNEEPYIEIPNFLDPDEVVRTIEEVKNSNYSKLFSDYVLRVDWEAGYQNTFDAINLLQVSES